MTTTTSPIPSASIVAMVPTADPASAREFYGNVLGLTLISEDSFALQFDANGTVLRLPIMPAVEPRPGTTVGWSVDDVPSAVRALVERGVVFEQFPGMPQDELGIWSPLGGGGVAWFKDPEGNLLSISHR